MTSQCFQAVLGRKRESLETLQFLGIRDLAKPTSLELLSRFELETSSLPTHWDMSKQRYPALFGPFLCLLEWFIVPFFPLFPHSFSACGSGCGSGTKTQSKNHGKKDQKPFSKFAPLNKEDNSPLCPLNPLRKMHHMVPSQRRQYHPASSQSPPKHQ